MASHGQILDIITIQYRPLNPVMYQNPPGHELAVSGPPGMIQKLLAELKIVDSKCNCMSITADNQFESDSLNCQRKVFQMPSSSGMNGWCPENFHNPLNDQEFMFKHVAGAILAKQGWKLIGLCEDRNFITRSVNTDTSPDNLCRGYTECSYIEKWQKIE
ncbi:unnamed protein product [Owenia fusiformis]|uniref:Uncharacterized protein n=1 Tax=Owenia fusiformis TaxID=6347 RepID=A0A8J1TDK3_OWEFU|nr:unnamed protein product [Owenia fusiformis]